MYQNKTCWMSTKKLLVFWRSNGGNIGKYIFTFLLFAGPTRYWRNRFLHPERDNAARQSPDQQYSFNWHHVLSVKYVTNQFCENVNCLINRLTVVYFSPTYIVYFANKLSTIKLLVTICMIKNKAEFSSYSSYPAYTMVLNCCILFFFKFPISEFARLPQLSHTSRFSSTVK